MEHLKSFLKEMSLRLSPKDKEILDFLASVGEASISEICKATEIHQNTAYKYVDALYKANLVDVVPSTKRFNVTVVKLNEYGKGMNRTFKK